MSPGNLKNKQMKKLLHIILILLVSQSVISFAQNAPISTVGTVTTTASTVVVPITAINFSNIGSCNQQLTYDPSIATATGVTIGPHFGGGISINISTPGVVRFGWYIYPGATVPDGSVIFNISFTKVNNGFTAVSWDPNYIGREWTNGSFAALNDLPFNNYYINGSLTFTAENGPVTSIPNLSACAGSLLTVPVSVADFDEIGAFTLTMHYDPSALVYQSFTNNSSFPGFSVSVSNPGVLIATGITSQTNGISLVNGSILFSAHFNASGSNSGLNWFDNGASCQYKGPAPAYGILNDIPQASFYIDGSFTALPLPGNAGEISGPVDGSICQGQTGVMFGIDPVQNALSYIWNLPVGATITNGNGSNMVTVSFNQNALSGLVTVFAQNGCGAGGVSPAFSLSVNSPPSIIQQPVTPGTITAGAGIAVFEVLASGNGLNYQWQEYIVSWENISDGGIYEGTLTSSLSITDPPYEMNGYAYRCIVSGFCEPAVVTDGTAILNLNPPPCPLFDIPFLEDFSNLQAGDIPLCWSTSVLGSDNWGALLQNNAGGTIPEMNLRSSPLFTGQSLLISPQINVNGHSILILRFDHAIDIKNPSVEDYSIGLLTTTNGDDWKTIWIEYPVTDVEPETLEFEISIDEGESESLRFAFFFEGPINNINNWWIDNISLAIAEPVVPENLLLDGIAISGIESVCFNATNTIIVTDFVILPGSSVEFIAGEKIILGTGTFVNNGAYMLARISDTYCTQPPGLLTNKVAETRGNEPVVPVFDDNIFRVFPNPASSLIRIELSGSDPIPFFILEIYNMQGEILQKEFITDQHHCEINLLSWKQGIYLVRVNDGNKTETARIIKH